MTIARIWRGITLAANADPYLQYLEECVAPAYRAMGGCAGFFAMKECQGELVHFLLLSLWTSREALDRFLGSAPSALVTPCPADRSLVLTFESVARHYQVVCAPESPAAEVEGV